MNSNMILRPLVEQQAVLQSDTAVMLHCSASSGGQWKRLRKRLPEWYQTEAPDQYGCGTVSSWSGQKVFSLSDEARPVLDLIQTMVGSVHLVGHSYGGALAMHIAQKWPAAIASLTLIEPCAFHLLKTGNKDDQILFGEIFDVAQAVNEAIVTGDYQRGARAFIDYWNGADAWLEASDNMRQRMVQSLDKIALDFRALFAEEASLTDFSLLPVPTKIIHGTKSPNTSLRIVEMLVNTLPFVDEGTIEMAGHMSPLTHADQVSDLICHHMAQHSQSERIDNKPHFRKIGQVR